MRLLRWTLVIVVFAFAAVSCGGSRAFVSTAVATPLGSLGLQAQLPRSSGPGLGPAHPFFVDARHGFVATTGGAWWVPKSGVQPPLASAEIDETSDGGATWRTLVRVPHAAFDAVAFSGRRGFALGAHVLSTQAPAPPGRLVMFSMATSDGGASWRRVAAPFPASATAYPTPGAIPVALQLFGRVVYAELGGRAMRSRDGGRSWVRVSVPSGATLVRFASQLVGYAGVGAFCGGGETLWRTSDGGGSWQPVGGSCGPPFADVEAHARVVVTAQSTSLMQLGGEHSLLRLSLNGGVTWRVVVDTRRWRAVAFASFANGRNGVAVSAENDQGFQYDQLHVTLDGGRTWVVRREPFGPVTPFGPAPTPPAFAGDGIWVGEPNDGLLWRSRDLGRAWTVSSLPEYLGLRRLLAVRGRTLVVDTDAGALRSADGGGSWYPTPRPGPRTAAAISGANAYLAQTGDGLQGVAYLRRGQRWGRLHPPTVGVGALAFGDASHGDVASGQGDGYGRVPVAATSDGGRTWRTIRVPRGVKRGDHAVVGPDVVVLIEAPTLYVSLDDGAHWQRLRVPRNIFDCVAANYSGNVWLSCGGPGTGPASLLRSTDGGRSWTSRRSQLSLLVTPVASAAAWAAPSSAFLTEHPQTLWHTADGGQTWRAIWPRISPDAPILLSPH